MTNLIIFILNEEGYNLKGFEIENNFQNTEKCQLLFSMDNFSDLSMKNYTYKLFEEVDYIDIAIFCFDEHVHLGNVQSACRIFPKFKNKINAIWIGGKNIYLEKILNMLWNQGFVINSYDDNQTLINNLTCD